MPNIDRACELGWLKSILGPEHMKARCLISGFVLAALSLVTPSLWAQDGMGGALSRLGVTRSLLNGRFEQRLAAADFDNDQRPDGAVLVDTGQFDGQKIFRIELHLTAVNNSDLTFESNDLSPAISALDVNQDGAADIVVEESFTHKRLYVWLNDGHGAFRKARTEDFPSAGRDGPYQFKAASLAQDCPAPYLPSKLGSELAIAKAAAPSFGSLAADRHLWPVALAFQTQADAPNPTRGPPSFLSL